jgi:glycosyltransferase involved in cell wall biosynthesis
LISGKLSISIITVAKNSASTIKDCIQSVVGQNYPAEQIFVDGCSTDNTLDIVRNYAPKKAKIISEPDQSLYHAMNKGLALATSDIVAILNSDDYFAHSGVLSKVERVFQNPTVDSCYGDIVYVDRMNTSKIVRYWRSGLYEEKSFYQGWMPPHPTFFARRTAYEKFGGFNLSMGLSADYELMLRFLFKNKISAEYIPEVMVVMRTGGQGNASLRNRWRANRGDKSAWKVNGLKPRPWTMIAKPLGKFGQYLFKNSEELSGVGDRWWEHLEDKSAGDAVIGPDCERSA